MYNKNILIGIFKNNKNKSIEYLNELNNLLSLFKGIVYKTFLQRRLKPNNLTFVGKGYLDKISIYVKKKFIDTVIFDDELSLSQYNNIEKKLKCFISDRTKLILDIFSYRAKTSYAKIQVKLAKYQYLLPRLKNMWSHLERQKGGIGLRGPGEKEIETDRRLIRQKIINLKKKLKKINNQIFIQRKNRINQISLSLVGYTNVGKTTIINKITKQKLFTDNKLFTTLDTNVNKFYFKNKKFLLIDTIGFLRKIPTKLIESFKSSIIEIQNSDIILHIIDISTTFILDKFLYVTNFLFNELKVYNKNIIIVFNKIDKIKNFNIFFIKKIFGIKIFKNKYLIYKKKRMIYICISTKNRNYILKLKSLIYNVTLKINKI
ncbi:MAG: GTPase HflX [Candidatus Shikimatogenerans bostrichidophilus]|nr:MAG: GTPase HflX [Candidatus Shikimatogenerans bostrichidophilus]